MRMGRVGLVQLAILACTTLVVAQPQETESPTEEPGATFVGTRIGDDPPTSLKLHVSLSRYQGQQRVSSVPYELGIVATPGAPSQAKIRMGVDVAVQVKGSQEVQYRNVGTNLDFVVRAPRGDRYHVSCSVEQSSVYDAGEGSRGEGVLTTLASVPAFRTLRVSASGLLVGGESRTFTSATDPVSGEVLKVEVTLHVVK